MRRFLIIPLFIVIAGSALNAQVNISDLRVDVINDNVEVSFMANIANNAAKSSYTLFVVPTLTNGVTRLPLSSIVVQGKRAQVAEKRYTMSRLYPGLGQPIFTDNGQMVPYNISIPYQSWMSNVQLVLDKYERGCCSDVVLPSEVIATNLALGSAEPVPVQVRPVQVQEPVIVPSEPVVVPSEPASSRRYVVVEEPVDFDESMLSTADMLTRHFSFIAPICQFENSKRRANTGDLFDYNMPLSLGRGITRAQQSDLDRFIDENRDDALSIYFKTGSYIVERNFADNSYALVDMISVIRAIQASNDSRVVRIVIAGFASPEGNFLFNDRLAWERAVSLKEVVLNNTNLPNRAVNIYNGSVDWRGLYRLVAESDMYHKYQILNIIDYTPAWGDTRNISRLDELKRLNGGEPYNYMLHNIFPLLRNAAYIKVYYENLNNVYPLMNCDPRSEVVIYGNTGSVGVVPMGAGYNEYRIIR